MSVIKRFHCPGVFTAIFPTTVVNLQAFQGFYGNPLPQIASATTIEFQLWNVHQISGVHTQLCE